MKRVLDCAAVRVAIVVCGLLCFPLTAPAQQGEGETLFNQICVACHTIGKGKLVGPDLADVHKRRPEDWLINYIKSSQTVIKSGDPYAVNLFEEYNKQLMPDNNYTDSQVLSVIAYIAANSPVDETVAVEAQASEPERPVTEENVGSGRLLFVGKKRFANGGPTCNTCHNLQFDGAITGGTLAKDLTDSYTRLSGVGVKAMMASSPFPAMRQAFEGKPLTDDELFDLTAFLQYVDSESGSQSGRRYGARMFFSGLGGAILLFGLFGGVWYRAKRRSVNHDINERQVKSTWE